MLLLCRQAVFATPSWALSCSQQKLRPWVDVVAEVLVVQVRGGPDGCSLEVLHRSVARQPGCFVFAGYTRPLAGTRMVKLRGVEFYAFTTPHEDTIQVAVWRQLGDVVDAGYRQPGESSPFHVSQVRAGDSLSPGRIGARVGPLADLYQRKEFDRTAWVYWECFWVPTTPAGAKGSAAKPLFNLATVAPAGAEAQRNGPDSAQAAKTEDRSLQHLPACVRGWGTGCLWSEEDFLAVVGGSWCRKRARCGRQAFTSAKQDTGTALSKAEAFSEIYRRNVWPGLLSRSGPGSGSLTLRSFTFQIFQFQRKASLAEQMESRPIIIVPHIVPPDLGLNGSPGCGNGKLERQMTLADLQPFGPQADSNSTSWNHFASRTAAASAEDKALQPQDSSGLMRDGKVSVYSKDEASEAAPRDRASVLAGAQDALFSPSSPEVRKQDALLEGDEGDDEDSENFEENGAGYFEEDHPEEDPEDDEAVYLSEAYREWELHYLRRLAMRIHRLLTMELDRSEEALFAVFVQHDANLDGRVRGDEATKLMKAIEDCAPGSLTQSTPQRKDGSISLVSLLRWYTGSSGSEHKASSYSFSAATLLTGLLGSGVVGCDARLQALDWLSLRRNVMGYRRIYSQLRELKEEKMVTMIMEKESQTGLLETMPEYYKLLAKEFEGDMELLFELFCEVDESNNLMLEEREVEIMLRKMDTGATPEDLRRYVSEINLAFAGHDYCLKALQTACRPVMADGSSEAPTPEGLPEEVKKKRINVLGFEVAVAENKVRKVFLGATGFFIIFNSLTLPFALPKLRRFLGAPYVPMKRNAVEAQSEVLQQVFRRLALPLQILNDKQLQCKSYTAAVLDAASLAEVLTNTAAGRLRCCSRLLRFVGREPGGRFLCAALHEDADRLRPLLKGSFVWWERLVTLDLAKTLEIGGSGLKRGLCRSLAEDGTMWIVEDDTRIAFLQNSWKLWAFLSQHIIMEPCWVKRIGPPVFYP
eukprot:s3096_g6.t3